MQSDCTARNAVFGLFTFSFFLSPFALPNV